MVVLFIAGVSTVLYVGAQLVFSSVDGEGGSLARSLLIEVRRSEALRLRKVEIAESMSLKSAITEELIAGRLTLREAEERFRDADTIVESDREGLLPHYRLASSDRELCRQVMAWTENKLKEKLNPREARRVQRQLRRQVEEQFPHEKIFY
jgi:hypothetical protein